MPLSKSLVQPFRRNMLCIGSGWRAFFAPFNIMASVASNNTGVGPFILDLQNTGPFNSNTPPAGFTDLGWIKDMKLTPGSKIGQVRSGYRGAVRAQYRGEVGETFEFKFREFSRMAWKIATGTSMFNLLSNPAASTVGPLSGSGAVRIPLTASGYQVNGAGLTAGSPTLFVPAGSGTLFAANNWLVADSDYTPGTSGLQPDAGVPVLSTTSVVDVDYIRKTSDYVARVLSVVPNAVAGADGVVLSQPIVGGGSATTGQTPQYGPQPTDKIQLIKGFAAREGGTFISEWSGLFLMDTIDGAQIALYYPHVSINQFRDISNWAIENIGTTDLTGWDMDCVMTSLAFDDPLDGETVVCYRAYYPAAGEEIAI